MSEPEASAYRIRLAGEPVPIVASLPHSGLYVPPAMRSELSGPYRDFLPHQDWHLDRLYSFLPRLGVTMLLATHSRYVADANRSGEPPHLGGFWRAAVPDTAPRNEPLYREAPSAGEVERRMEDVYRPFHERLQGLLEETRARFGRAYLLDLHSYGLPGDYRVCLGDANGASCSERFVVAAERAWALEGFEVSRNRPFNGGHIVRKAAELAGVEALQVEVSYALYLDPDDLEKPKVPDPEAAALARARPRFRRVMESLIRALVTGSDGGGRA